MLHPWHRFRVSRSLKYVNSRIPLSIVMHPSVSFESVLPSFFQHFYIATNNHFLSSIADGTTEDINRILTWLLAGMPAVESFSFGHGETSMTRKDEKTYSYPSLPGISPPGGVEVMWPHTLKHLSLSCFSLGTDTFTANTEFPSLKTLELKKCGGNVDTIMNGLRSTHPNVAVTKIEQSSRW